MASVKKQVMQLARQLFRLSFVEDELSADRINGVLQYVEKSRPTHSVALLKAYHRLIAAELARRQAIVEYAGAINPTLLASIGATMTTRYGRRISTVPRRNDSLLAGLRVRIGDDVFESSIASQLGQLANAV